MATATGPTERGGQQATTKTTDEMDDNQEVCAIEPPKRQKVEQKLQWQQTVDTLDKLSKLFDKSFLAELTSENTWMDRLRRAIERGTNKDSSYTNPLWS